MIGTCHRASSHLERGVGQQIFNTEQEERPQASGGGKTHSGAAQEARPQGVDCIEDAEQIEDR